MSCGLCSFNDFTARGCKADSHIRRSLEAQSTFSRSIDPTTRPNIHLFYRSLSEPPTSDLSKSIRNAHHPKIHHHTNIQRGSVPRNSRAACAKTRRHSAMSACSSPTHRTRRLSASRRSRSTRAAWPVSASRSEAAPPGLHTSAANELEKPRRNREGHKISSDNGFRLAGNQRLGEDKRRERGILPKLSASRGLAKDKSLGWTASLPTRPIPLSSRSRRP